MTVFHWRIPLVFRQRQYVFYFSGNLVSWIGNSMQFIANSWLALTLGGSLTAVARAFSGSRPEEYAQVIQVKAKHCAQV